MGSREHVEMLAEEREHEMYSKGNKGSSCR